MYSPHKKVEDLDLDKAFPPAFEKNVKRAFALTFGIWIASLMFGLGILGTAAYIAYHFITKYW